MKKVLVTGGNGFIGGHVVDELYRRGYEVTIFCRHEVEKGHYMSPKVPFRLFYGDMKDREAVLHAVSKHDGAINLAGILGTSETVDNPYPSVEVNILGGLNFLQAVREYKLPAVQIAVGNHYMNNSYAITKTATERLALMFNKEHGTKIAVVRGLNAYGTRQKHAPVRKITPNFIVKALQKKPIKINGNGEQIMDMILVTDLARILVDALVVDHRSYDTVFEAGPGHRVTVNKIAEYINEIADNPAGVIHVPMRAGEPDNAVVVADPKTLKPLGIKPGDLKSFEQGIPEVVEWYMENYPWEKAE